MRIYSSATEQEAKTVQDKPDPRPFYKCYLQGRDTNEGKNAHPFVTIEEAAKFLIDNPGSGIRCDPGHAIVSTNLLIER